LPTPSRSQRPGLALLSNGVSPHNDNHARILAALDADGWRVEVFAHDSLSLQAGEVCAAGTPLMDFDLVWMLGLGERGDFLDRCQILNALPASRLVNSPVAMLALHSKHAPLPYQPPTYSSSNPDELLRCASTHATVQRWVVKPSAGSYGRGVRRAETLDELATMLEHATANGSYCVLQAYVEEIAAGETRTLVLNGKIIGSYLRVPDRDFLANLSLGGRARLTELNSQQQRQVATIAAQLAAQGVRFAAIDMAFPWLIETNIANPGGLATLASLGGSKPAEIGERLARALRTLLS